MNKTNAVRIVQDKVLPVKGIGLQKITVTVHIPERLHERVRQQKINRIYDILKPDIAR